MQTPARERRRTVYTVVLGGLRPEHLYKAVGLAFLLGFLFRHFRAISQVLLLLYAVAIFAVLLNAIVQRVPIGRRWTAGLLGIVFLGAIVALFWFGVPVLLAQLRGIANQAPELEARLQGAEQWIRGVTGLNVELVGPEAEEFLRNAFLTTAGGGGVIARARGLLEILLVPVLVLTGALFAVGSPNDRLLTPFLRAVPRGLRPDVRRMCVLMGERIVGWGKGTLIGMLAVGLLSYALFSLIGIPNALLLGVLSGLTELIPILGPWVGGAVATLVAFLHNPNDAVWTALAALAVQQFENNLIIPWAMSRSADLHPLVTLFAVVLFGSLFGFLGVLLSVPLALLFWTLVQVLWVERAIEAGGDRIAPVVEE